MMDTEKRKGSQKELAYLSFTDRGQVQAEQLAKALGGEVSRCGSNGVSLHRWTAEKFSRSEGLIFVGAVGIAVRAIAPHVSSKANDPAVVVVDEGGNFAISLLSGHLGSGNDLARQAADICGATPVITTATDVNGVFAVDEWAKRQNCHVENPDRIKVVSSALLHGKAISVRCMTDIKGQPPAGVIPVTETKAADVMVDILRGEEDALYLTPRIAVVGIGCRKGTSKEQIRSAYDKLLAETGLSEKAICLVASIDLKKEEAGLLEFCKDRGLPFVTFSAEELDKIPGEFSPSRFVKKTIGVDNVCERSAVAASDGILFCRKQAGDGVTMAVALKPFEPDWRWKDE